MAGEDISDTAALASVFAAVSVLITFFFLQSRLTKRVSALMGVKSDTQIEDHVEELKAEEVAARAIPVFCVHEADSWSKETMAARKKHERHVLRFLRQLCLADFANGLAYALFPIALGLAVNDSGAAIFGYMIGFVLCVSALLRYLLLRRKFRAFNLARSRGLQRFFDIFGWIISIALFITSILTRTNASGIQDTPDFLRALFGLRARLILTGVLATSALIIAFFSLTDAPVDYVLPPLGLLAAAVLHSATFLIMARRMRATPGLQLLVLRVFDIDETSAFTFSGLMKYWGFFGNHYTIVDAAFLRQRNETNITKSVFVVLLLVVIAFMLVMASVETLDTRAPWLPDWIAALLPLILFVALPAWGLFARAKRKIAGQFIRTGAQLSERLDFIDQHPRDFDLKSRHVQAMCHDNTWFPAVAEFARRADVIMMDLRGYSEERKGCQREVDFLFDAVALDRILFLMDVGDDPDLITDMLLDRFRELRKTSPNLDLTAPEIHCYLARDNDKRDMQGILDQLISGADHGFHGDGADVSPKTHIADAPVLLDAATY